MTSPLGIVRVSVLAERNGLTPRCLKRRLRKLDARVRAANGPGILVQFTPLGDYYADLAVLKKHAPGLFEGDPEDRVAALTNQVEELLALVHEIRNDTATIRLFAARQ